MRRRTCSLIIDLCLPLSTVLGIINELDIHIDCHTPRYIHNKYALIPEKTATAQPASDTQPTVGNAPDVHYDHHTHQDDGGDRVTPSCSSICSGSGRSPGHPFVIFIIQQPVERWMMKSPVVIMSPTSSYSCLSAVLS